MKVGDKVVCIVDYSPVLGIYYDTIPVQDTVTYTVREISHGGMYLNEVINKPTKACGGLEPNFTISNFRKVDESFADSVLEKITEQIKEEELELV